jgi:hypothetical protein
MTLLWAASLAILLCLASTYSALLTTTKSSATIPTTTITSLPAPVILRHRFAISIAAVTYCLCPCQLILLLQQSFSITEACTKHCNSISLQSICSCSFNIHKCINLVRLTLLILINKHSAFCKAN